MTTIPILTGRLVVPKPAAEEHAAALLASTPATEWAWKPVPKPATVEDMSALLSDVMISPDGGRYPLVVVRRSDDLVIGSTTLHTLDFTQRSVEIGWTWLDQRCWGQGYNEDMKHVLLGYCFGPLRLSRVQWTVDGANLRSQRALERLGFVKEGTLRSHRVRVDKSRADTVVYSLLADEWPEAAVRLKELIDERTPAAP